MTDNVMIPDAFFGLVDEFLTPATAQLGYHRIGGFRNDEPRSRGVLTTMGAPSSEDGAPLLVYDFGFEAGSGELGWKSLGVLELTALPSIDEERWVATTSAACWAFHPGRC